MAMVALGHGDPGWYNYLKSLPTSVLEAMRKEHARLVAEPGESTFQMIDRILEDRKGRET